MTKHIEECTAPASEARECLAHLIGAREEIASTQVALHAALQRLAEAKALETPVLEEIARLDAEETAAMDRWSRSAGDEPPPVSDTTKRGKLAKRLEEARARANAAERAEPGQSAEYVREAGKLPPIAAAIDLAVAQVLIEEAAPLVTELAEVTRTASEKAERFSLAVDLVNALGHRQTDKEVAARIFATTGPLVERFAEAARRPMPDIAVTRSYRTEWHALIDRLRSDANAKLGE